MLDGVPHLPVLVRLRVSRDYLEVVKVINLAMLPIVGYMYGVNISIVIEESQVITVNGNPALNLLPVNLRPEAAVDAFRQVNFFHIFALCLMKALTYETTPVHIDASQCRPTPTTPRPQPRVPQVIRSL